MQFICLLKPFHLPWPLWGVEQRGVRGVWSRGLVESGQSPFTKGYVVFFFYMLEKEFTSIFKPAPAELLGGRVYSLSQGEVSETIFARSTIRMKFTISIRRQISRGCAILCQQGAKGWSRWKPPALQWHTSPTPLLAHRVVRRICHAFGEIFFSPFSSFHELKRKKRRRTWR